ncbi:hemerythrin domain-containing protein [Methylocaldum szegediense]|nr:hemerythrin domain-containing protein [Methylocaldum szegediense]
MNTLEQSPGGLAGATRSSRPYTPESRRSVGQNLHGVVLAPAKRQWAQEINEELEKSASQPTSEAGRWKDAPPSELVAHILEHFHQRHRQQLPELTRLARMVERVHGEHPACPRGLADTLDSLRHELEDHMQTEEQVLFPLIARGEGTSARTLILVMRMEDHHHAEALKRLDKLTRGFTPPPVACSTWRALYLGLSGLCVDLMEHVYLEDNVLFQIAAPTRKRETSHG